MVHLILSQRVVNRFSKIRKVNKGSLPWPDCMILYLKMLIKEIKFWQVEHCLYHSSSLHFTLKPSLWKILDFQDNCSFPSWSFSHLYFHHVICSIVIHHYFDCKQLLIQLAKDCSIVKDILSTLNIESNPKEYNSSMLPNRLDKSSLD